MNDEQNKKNMTGEEELQNAAGGKTPSGIAAGLHCPLCGTYLYYEPIYDYEGKSYCRFCYDKIVPHGVNASW